MRTLNKATLCAAALLAVGGVAGPADAVMQKRTVAGDRVELHVLPAELFFSKQEQAQWTFFLLIA